MLPDHGRWTVLQQDLLQGSVQTGSRPPLLCPPLARLQHDWDQIAPIAAAWLLPAVRVIRADRCSWAQVAGRTNDSAGDGTTTASVLARDMIHYGLQV